MRRKNKKARGAKKGGNIGSGEAASGRLSPFFLLFFLRDRFDLDAFYAANGLD
jgi:hypothetical protein